MKQEASHQVNKIERTTHTIARKVVVSRRERRQPKVQGLFIRPGWEHQVALLTEEEPDHESSGDERIEMHSDLYFCQVKQKVP